MANTKVSIALVVLGTFLFGAINAKSSQPDNVFVDCQINGGEIAVDMGRTHPPTMFWVLGPDGKAIQLVNPGEKVDTIGARYNTGKFSLSIAETKGVEVSGSERKNETVFATSGRYSLRFQDANAMAGSELRQFSCEVDVASSAFGDSTGEKLYATNSDGSMAMFPVGCNYFSNCGGTGKPCCKKSTDGAPCYCSTCCIAKSTGANALASVSSKGPISACGVP